MFKFKAHFFVDRTRLTSAETQHLVLMNEVMECLRLAGEETGDLTRDDVRALGHCLLAATAMLDVCQEMGVEHTRLVRCGLQLTGEKARKTNYVVMGHPSVPETTPLWNGHMVVGSGRFLLDPTFGQLREKWNTAADVAVFEHRQAESETLRLYGGHMVRPLAHGRWVDSRGAFDANLFELPAEVERATRAWGARPDARPETRHALVARTLELLRDRLTRRPVDDADAA